ncbi:MAG: oligosaccharide flippase family protein [Kofleriaceae bacterium]
MTAVRRGLAWTGLASAVVGGLDVIATLVLLRWWLTPAEYGIAALVTPLYPMLDLVADAGFTAAVIQHDDDDPATVSTAFWAACACSAAVAVALLGVGPLLAWLHGTPIVAGLVAGYGVKLILQNGYMVPGAVLRRRLAFGTLARIRSAGAAAEFVGKLGAAAAGWGVWCFVVGQLAKTVVLAVATVRAARFWPSRQWDRLALRRLWAFGGRASASQVLFHLYTNADYQIVGLWFGPTATGLYRAAYELVLEPAKLLSYVVVEVAFPVFAKLRGQAAAARAQLFAFTRHNLAVLVPVMTALVLAPGSWLELCFGAEWRAAAPAVQLLGVVGVLRALAFLLPPLLDGLGRADLTLRYMVVAAVAVPGSQVVAAATVGGALGWQAVALAWAIGYPIAFAVLMALALELTATSIADYLRAVAPVLAVGACGAVAGLAATAVAPSAAAPRVLMISAAVALVDGGAGWWLIRRARRRS